MTIRMLSNEQLAELSTIAQRHITGQTDYPHLVLELSNVVSPGIAVRYAEIIHRDQQEAEKWTMQYE